MEAIAIIGPDGAVAQTGWTGSVPWWSFTKTALSVAALRLADEGLLALDEPLSDERYTPRQLLRHEAGLPDYGTIAHYHADVATGKQPWSTSRLLEAVDASRLRYVPGAGWAYSNIGYLKVAQLIEQASGRDLAAALASLVFEPSGLSTARLATDPADLADVQMGSASGYHPGWVYHGLVVGSVADAARLLWLLTQRALLKPATWAAMKVGRALPEHRSNAHPDAAYGLGLMLAAKDPDTHPMGHGGAGPGSTLRSMRKTARRPRCGRRCRQRLTRTPASTRFWTTVNGELFGWLRRRKPPWISGACQEEARPPVAAGRTQASQPTRRTLQRMRGNPRRFRCPVNATLSVPPAAHSCEPVRTSAKGAALGPCGRNGSFCCEVWGCWERCWRRSTSSAWCGAWGRLSGRNKSALTDATT